MIQVYAKDATGSDIIDPATVEIYVTDINDNAPKFDQDQYTGHVKEHSPPGKLKVYLMSTLTCGGITFIENNGLH